MCSHTAVVGGLVTATECSVVLPIYQFRNYVLILVLKYKYDIQLYVCLPRHPLKSSIILVQVVCI